MMSALSLEDRIKTVGTAYNITPLLEGLQLVVPIGIVVIGSTLAVLVLVWLERKLAAAAQQRIGPEYAGPLGTVQALIDGLKLLLKEDIIPSKADPYLFTLAPALGVIPVLLSLLVVPFGDHLILADIPLGMFYWLAVSSIAPLGLLVAGYSSNNKYAFLGGLRAAAQAISYELPLALCILAVTVLAHSLSPLQVVDQQAHWGILGWNVWRQPIGFGVFLIAALAECERLPFDLPEAEEELVAGYQTEYSGMKFGLFYVGAYLNLFISALFATVLYLGGWSPIFNLQAIQLPHAWTLLGPGWSLLWTLLKAYLFIAVAILTRWTLPRVRIDQLLDLGWKFLLPLALGNLVLTASFELYTL